MQNQALNDLLFQLEAITTNYQQEQKTTIEEKFNYFTVVSNKYHYENFHSDVIAFLLNNKEKHGQGNLFVNEFIELLKKIDSSILGFTNVKVFREHGRIDILLRDEENKKSIIIENKINNAIDQDNQLTRYYNYEKNYYDPIAIFYLSLNGDKVPPLADQIVQSKIHQLAAFKGTELDLYKGWLMQCLPKIMNSEVKSFINQYAHLYKIMSKELINHNLMKEFLDIISSSQKKYETAMISARMMYDLQPYIMYRLAEQYQHSDCNDMFKKIEPYSGVDEEKGMYWVVMHDSILSEQGFDLILELWIKTLNRIEVHLFAREQLSDKNRLILDQVVASLNLVLEYQDNSTTNHYGYFKEFIFPEQQGEMDVIITQICKGLKQINGKLISSNETQSI